MVRDDMCQVAGSSRLPRGSRCCRARAYRSEQAEGSRGIRRSDSNRSTVVRLLEVTQYLTRFPVVVAQMMRRVLLIGWTAILSGIGCLGCDRDSSPPVNTELVSVQGTITYQRAPRPQTLVLFIPVASGEIGASGMTNREGQYSLRQKDGRPGIAPGTYKVAFRVLSQMRAPGTRGPDSRDMLNSEDTSFQAEVSAANTALDFDLH